MSENKNSENKQESTPEPHNKITVILIAVVTILLVAAGAVYFYLAGIGKLDVPTFGEVVSDVVDTAKDTLTGEPTGVAKFASQTEFKQYLSESDSQYYGMGIGMVNSTRTAAIEPEIDFDEFAMSDDVAMAEMGSPSGMGGALKIDRVSETNVQVQGIDEPDIVKTDGEELFYSREDYYYWYYDEDSSDENATKMINIFPPEDMELDGEIEANGNLLLADDVLLVIDWYQVQAFDVSDPANPEELWEIEYEDAGYETARLLDGKLYLVTSTWIDSYDPCPITPLRMDGESIEVVCTDIYRPNATVPVDTTYDIFVIDPDSGKIEESVTFAGSYGDTVVYMSSDNIYLTYSYTESMLDLMADFLENEAYDLLDSNTLQRIRNLRAYDISDQAKMIEFQVIMEDFLASLDDDEQLRIENEMEDRADDYMDEHKRELVTTGIVKIDTDDLSIDATGEVPGYPLNQFSLDEYDNHLRIATTVGGGWFSLGGSSESVNDLYVLDRNLNQTGSVLDMGEGETIYSARFIGDQGYIVTFRQVDPFYVLDLSDHKNPEKVGELKIPGYSSYLHPLSDDRILGIGQEDSEVKLSLFDVSDPSDPQEADKYLLDEYWSDVLETHHAFLHDSEFGIFFMPGGQGGYIFGYEDDDLTLEKAVANIDAERAIFINNYLYVVGLDEIVVLDENSWERVAEFEIVD
jgi:inhibitor of cysteine peptidase